MSRSTSRSRTRSPRQGGSTSCTGANLGGSDPQVEAKGNGKGPASSIFGAPSSAPNIDLDNCDTQDALNMSLDNSDTQGYSHHGLPCKAQEETEISSDGEGRPQLEEEASGAAVLGCRAECRIGGDEGLNLAMFLEDNIWASNLFPPESIAYHRVRGVTMGRQVLRSVQQFVAKDALNQANKVFGLPRADNLLEAIERAVGAEVISERQAGYLRYVNQDLMNIQTENVICEYCLSSDQC